MEALGTSFVLLTSLLKARIPIPVTKNMVIVAIVGFILTVVLANLPGLFKLLSGIAALATIVLLIVVGIDDYRGGDLVDRATGSDCAGWNGYVDTIDQLRTD